MSYSAPSTYTPRSRPTYPPTATTGAPAGQAQSRTGGGVLIPFILSIVILLGVTGYGVFRPQNHVHPAAPGERGSLVWGNGIFANRLELSAWLHQHHASFAKFAEKHPAALRLVPLRAASESSAR